MKEHSEPTRILKARDVVLVDYMQGGADEAGSETYRSELQGRVGSVVGFDAAMRNAKGGPFYRIRFDALVECSTNSHEVRTVPLRFIGIVFPIAQ